tara:strand:- start:349 stop:657 length:309 start_codon:yes stop_codon:yes gene_type:complete
MSKNNHQNSLSTQLSDWQVFPVSEPQFRERVWERIEQRKRESAWPGYLHAHAATAASFALIAVIAGGVTGYAQARGQAREHREAMASAYVESIDVASQINQR